MTEMRERPDVPGPMPWPDVSWPRGGEVVKTVVLPHECSPGWRWEPIPKGVHIGLHGLVPQESERGRYGVPPSPWDYPKGTVWRCGNCGQHWVSQGALDAGLHAGIVGWRRESRWERRRRLGLRWWQRGGSK